MGRAHWSVGYRSTLNPTLMESALKQYEWGGPVIVSGVHLLRTHWCAQNRWWKEASGREVWFVDGERSGRDEETRAHAVSCRTREAKDFGDSTQPKYRKERRNFFSKNRRKQTNKQKRQPVTNCEDGFRSCVSRVSSTY